MRMVKRIFKEISHPELLKILSKIKNKSLRFVDPSVIVTEIEGVPKYNVELEYYVRSKDEQEAFEKQKRRGKGSRDKRSVPTEDLC